MIKDWVNPEDAESVEYINSVRVKNLGDNVAACSTCNGMGHHFYKDKDGKMKSRSCLDCGGTGQK